MNTNRIFVLVVRVFAIAMLGLSLFCPENTLAAAKKKKAPAKMVPVGKPEVFQLEPRGIQHGKEVQIKLIGTNLADATELLFKDKRLEGNLLMEPAPTTNELWIKVSSS